MGVTGGEVGERENLPLLRRSQAEPRSARTLIIIAEDQPSEHTPAQRLQTCRRQHALWRPAATHVEVEARAGAGDPTGQRGQQRTHDIAIRDQAQRRARRLHRRHQRPVALTVEHDHPQGSPRLPLQACQHLIERPVQVVSAQVETRSGGNLLHVHVGRMEQVATRRKGCHTQRARPVLRAQGRPLQRVDSDIDLGRRCLLWAIAEGLADIEHGRLIALALPDDDAAVHGGCVEGGAHGIDRSGVCSLLIALPDPRQAGTGCQCTSALEVGQQVFDAVGGGHAALDPAVAGRFAASLAACSA